MFLQILVLLITYFEKIKIYLDIKIDLKLYHKHGSLTGSSWGKVTEVLQELIYV